MEVIRVRRSSDNMIFNPVYDYWAFRRFDVFFDRYWFEVMVFLAHSQARGDCQYIWALLLVKVFLLFWVALAHSCASCEAKHCEKNSRYFLGIAIDSVALTLSGFGIECRWKCRDGFVRRFFCVFSQQEILKFALCIGPPARIVSQKQTGLLLKVQLGAYLDLLLFSS